MSFRNFGRLLLSAVFTVTAILLVLALVLYAKIEPQLPSIESLKDVQLQVPLRIYTSDRKLMAEFGEKRRTPVRKVTVRNETSIVHVASDRTFATTGA